MIIDNPHVMRDVIQETHPYFTHDGADEIYTERKDQMDQYAKNFGKLADEIWEREYAPPCIKEISAKPEKEALSAEL